MSAQERKPAVPLRRTQFKFVATAAANSEAICKATGGVSITKKLNKAVKIFCEVYR